MIITDTLQTTVLKLLLDTKLHSGVIIQHITQDDAIKNCKQTLEDEMVIHMHIKDEYYILIYLKLLTKVYELQLNLSL